MDVNTYLESTPMSNSPNPDPDLTPVPGGQWLAGLSLALLALLVGHILTTPVVLFVLAGFVAAFVLPVLLGIAVVRVIVVLPRVVEWACRKELPIPRTIPDRAAAEEAD